MKNLLILVTFFFCVNEAIAQDTVVKGKVQIDSMLNIQEYLFKNEFYQTTKGLHPSNGETQPSKISNKAIYADHPGSKENSLDRIQGPSQFDSRIELRQLVPLDETWKQKIIYNALSVGIVVEKSMIHQIDDSLWQLDVSTNLGQRFNLCPSEAFCKQPVAGFGTAFLIDNETMITAGHIFDIPFQDLVVLFGFEIINVDGSYEKVFKYSEIYDISGIENRSLELDVALFKLNRPANRIGLKTPMMNRLKTDAPVYMIGHPSGLPKKVALNAEITNNLNPLFFYTSLDAFQGNSGSPVFDFETHELIGVLVSGNLDYRWNGNCNETTLIQLDQTDGEKVIRIEAILNEFRE